MKGLSMETMLFFLNSTQWYHIRPLLTEMYWMSILNSEFIKNKSYFLFLFQQFYHNMKQQYQQILIQGQ